MQTFLRSLFVMVALAAIATTAPTTKPAGSIDSFVSTELNLAYKLLYANVGPSGTHSGCIIASPSTSDPNYYFHWIRDGAITAKVIIQQFLNGKSADANIENIIRQYVSFSQIIQTSNNPSGGLGEPKFNVDGSAFTGSWGRPQNDGPALRATALIKYANSLLDSGRDISYVSNLYNNAFPSNSIIKNDLEFVSHNWQNTGFDLWEEVKGTHFFTLMVQRRALIEGAALANRLNDSGAATFYQNQVSGIEATIKKFWNGNYLTVTIHMTGGPNRKTSGLDAGTILGAIHGDAGDGYYDATNERVLATAAALEASFVDLYPINKNAATTGHGTAIGRYPEDVYDGIGSSEGNPWMLTTAAYTELYRRATLLWTKAGEIKVTNASLPFFVKFNSAAKAGDVYKAGTRRFRTVVNNMNAAADAFLATIQYHTPTDGSGAQAEEWNRNTGFQQGARDLTWSYAAFITAALARAGTPNY